MVYILKISFLITFVSSKMFIDETKLNLIPDSNFSFNNNFNDGKLSEKFENEKNLIVNCLKINGIKRKSFFKCAGKNYFKVNQRFSKLLLNSEIELKEKFLKTISPICSEN